MPTYSYDCRKIATVHNAFNAGSDLNKAIEHAIANAKRDEKSRFIHSYSNRLWIEKTSIRDSFEIKPEDTLASVRARMKKESWLK